MIRTTLVAAALAMLLLAASAVADDGDFTKPPRFTWIVTTAADWNEVAAALAVSNGDGTVIAYPTGRVDHPWILLRRVEAGSVYIPDDEPHMCDMYSTVKEATSYYTAMGDCHSPMLMTVPDGNTLVISMRDCSSPPKRRVVSR